MKAYHVTSHNTQEAYSKLCRSKEKLDSMKQSGKANLRRKEQLETKEAEVCACSKAAMVYQILICMCYSASSSTKRISKDR